MTMPSRDEIEALLTLPPPVRALLAGCAGPGFWPGDVPMQAIRDGGPELVDPSLWVLAMYPEHVFARGAWLPASEAAILDLCGAEPRLEQSPDGRWRAANRDAVSEWEPTARLAALRLLAAVQGGA